MNFRYIFALLVTVTLAFTNCAAQQFLEETIDYDRQKREYRIYIPASYDGSTAFPLMFNFHGGGGDIASQVAIADMRSIADADGFIIVYPQALPDPNDDGSTNWLHKEPTSVDDVFFVEAMIDEIGTQYNIDGDRIYACGYSLGGELTYELACRLNDRIAAVGIVARTMGTAAFDNCTPSHPTGIITILGTDDFVSPYEGLEWNGIQFYLSADDTHAYWVTHNNSSSEANITQLPDNNQADGTTVELYSWEDGNGCVAVEHLKILGGGHDWPGSFGNMDIDATTEIWNYVSNYSLSGLISCNTSSVSPDPAAEISNFIIYPNPVSDQLTIGKIVAANQAYHIYALNGKLLLSGKLKPHETTIDISSLPVNSYVLKVGDVILRFSKS